MDDTDLPRVRIEKLVHGGQGIGELADGRKCFVWNALPGELVTVQLTKRKRDWAEGMAVEIIEQSPDRTAPKEPDIFTATSPWQIINFAKEAELKQAILSETFEREHVAVDWQSFYQDKQNFEYRNKMEYNFWFFNETGKVSLALHRRGSHQKVAVEGSVLAHPAINVAGKALVEFINKNKIEARPLKSVILRSSADGKVGISLFVNDKVVAEKFVTFSYPNSIFEIVYSNPKSPASVTTEVLQPSSDLLTDTLLGKKFSYTTRSFFQVNIPVYEAALKEIAAAVETSGQKQIVDLYSGVGSIGLSVVADNQRLTMVEISEESTAQAQQNIKDASNCKVVIATAEASLDYIVSDAVIIVDPPRVGLHADVTKRLDEVKPPTVIYLSCNPSTQARDIKLLLDTGYKITHARGYNFFPRTPHIESLFILKIDK